jgi:hypothetical protein
MKTFALIVGIAAALAFAAVPAGAASKHHRAKAARAAQPQIACTVVGCIPVPPGCHPEIGYGPDGTPTGFDVTVCGSYTLYGLNR